MKPSFNIAKTLNDYAKTVARSYRETSPVVKAALQERSAKLLDTIHTYGLTEHDHKLLLQRLVALLRVDPMNLHSTAYKLTARALIAHADHEVA